MAPSLIPDESNVESSLRRIPSKIRRICSGVIPVWSMITSLIFLISLFPSTVQAIFSPVGSLTKTFICLFFSEVITLIFSNVKYLTYPIQNADNKILLSFFCLIVVIFLMFDDSFYDNFFFFFLCVCKFFDNFSKMFQFF